MKNLLYLFLCTFLISCTQKNQENYIVKYDNREISGAEFINKLMVLGFIKHGETFYSKIYDEHFFEQSRSETLEHIINSLFYGRLSQKYQIKVTDAELEVWIKSRTPGINQEDIVYILKANNLSYDNWKTLFREQLIQNKIIEQLQPATEKTKENKTERPKKTSDDALLLAVLTFDDALEAKETHKRISKRSLNFEDALKNQNTASYSWVKTSELPFYNKIKNQRLNRISKPIETDWGTLLVKIKKKGKFPIMPQNTATSHSMKEVKGLLEEFKKDPKLQINTDLLYSLKIKK